MKGKHLIVHGLYKTPEYRVWKKIRGRCYYPHDPSYKNYGARGIKMSPTWLDSFVAFYRDMGPRPSPSHSIERINNDGDYERTNCRWATRIEQGNNRRDNILCEFGGKIQSLGRHCDELGLKYHSVYSRIWRSGETPIQAINHFLERKVA